jgi:hypothetical protein
MFTLQHIQSLDLKKFYAGPDKEGAGQEPYKIRLDLLYAYHNQKEAYVNAAILFCPCFLAWHPIDKDIAKSAQELNRHGYTDVLFDQIKWQSFYKRDRPVILRQNNRAKANELLNR